MNIVSIDMQAYALLFSADTDYLNFVYDAKLQLFN